MLAVRTRFFSHVFPITLTSRNRDFYSRQVCKYAPFAFRRRYREEDRVLRAGDSHEADGAAVEKECPRYPAQQDSQGRRSGRRDEEADKGHEDHCEFRGRTERGEPVRESRTETDEEPGETRNEMMLYRMSCDYILRQLLCNSSTTLRSTFLLKVLSVSMRERHLCKIILTHAIFINTYNNRIL